MTHEEKRNVLCEEIIILMERHGMKVFDAEYVLELLEKTELRAEKECSH